MSVLRKSLHDLSVADLDALVSSEARETDELEFKGALPFVPTKGQPAVADRWIEKGDRVGDYARNEILAELVAFANADGGTQILGLHETKDEPRRAEALQPLPNCEGLARRLLDATEDIIEPRLPIIEVRPIPAATDGSGYVVFRIGKSLSGPHRLTTTREFYVRRGERATRMTVREIKDHTLEMLRFADQLEAKFTEQHHATAREYQRLVRDAQGKPQGVPPLIIRVTAIPITPQSIPNLTRSQQLWWKGKGFRLKVDGDEIECGFPLDRCDGHPRVRLRSFVADVNPEYSSVPRLLRADGLVEFMMSVHVRDTNQGRSSPARIYIGWVVSLIVGTMCQVEHLRKRLAWDAVEFGLEIEVQTEEPLNVAWTDRHHNGVTLQSGLPLLLPRYSLTADSPKDDLITSIVRDLIDACGSTWDQKCAVPWESLQNP
jgi:hypothetical protein